jgi:ankyrin repeat protein
LANPFAPSLIFNRQEPSFENQAFIFSKPAQSCYFMKAILGIFIISLALHCGAKGNTNTIQYAAWSGNLENIKKYLADNPKLLSSKEGLGTLTAAAENGQSEMVAFLISQGADVNEKGFFDMTPLARVASTYSLNNDEKCAAVATILIVHGATIDPVDQYGDTPLLYAVEAHKSRLAQVLLEHGASQMSRFAGANAGTPLDYALRQGDMETVDVLLKYDPPLEAVNRDRETPLLWAVKSQKIQVARTLLEHGADVTHDDTDTSVRYLRPDFTDNSGKSPLHWAVLNDNKEMLSLLLEFKAPPNAVDQNGKTPLHLAAARGDKEMVRLLLDAKSPLEAVDHDGATPLFYAEAGEHKEVAEMLRVAGPNVQGAAIAGIAPPTQKAMRSYARRIADGDATAFDELANAAADLYRGINYQKDDARLKMNYYRMQAAFTVLGEEASKGNDKAFQALKKSLGVPSLKSFAPEALGTAAAAGNQEALDILLQHNQWGIMESSTILALTPSAETNLQPAVDYFIDLLINPANRNRGGLGSVKGVVEDAAAHGNQKAQAALEKFNAVATKQD